MAEPGKTETGSLPWEARWDEVMALVGKNFADSEISGADAVELGAIRRFSEVLEFDCALHHDPQIAREHGYDGVLAPLSSYLLFTVPPIWSPGDAAVFTSCGRDALPRTHPGRSFVTGLEPEGSAYLAAGLDLEMAGPVLVGDRLTRCQKVLESCELKETRVGCGAFMTWAWHIENQSGDVVAVWRSTMFVYEPADAPGRKPHVE